MMYKDFRAWDKRKERYVYHIQRCVQPPQDPWTCSQCFWDYLSNDDYVVEESIGLQDENNRELYENDVVEGLAMNSFPFKGEIIRQANAFVVRLENGSLLSKLSSYHLKRIGNTHIKGDKKNVRKNIEH